MMITQVLVVDTEKPREYLPRFLAAANGLQVIVISQERDTSRTRTMAHGFGALFVDAAQPHVNGACIWDILSTLRKVWSCIDGEYVTFAHPEFLWLPGMVENTKEWLASNGSTIALGNLRRLGAEKDIAYRGTFDGTLLALKALDEKGDISGITTKPWAYWKHEPIPYANGWVEDVFFARRDFLETVEFPYHGGMQPFQDVYDVMGVICDVLKRNELDVDVIRISRTANEMWHLHHNRQRSWICPEVREWFRGNAEYVDTPLTRDDLWERLLQDCTWTVMSDLRNGPGGTCTRYQADFSKWLQDGNHTNVAEYLENRYGAPNRLTLP